jgi:hypothetical protein
MLGFYLNSMDFESITQRGWNFEDFRQFNDRIGISAILVELRLFGESTNKLIPAKSQCHKLERGENLSPLPS